MKDINGNEIPKGAKVKLVNPSPGYNIGKNNPLVETRWECEGSFLGGCSVRWSNGTRNGYNDGELMQVGAYIDIWCQEWH